MDTDAFKEISYSVSRAVGARLAALFEPANTPNFHVAELLLGSRKRYLLCSRDDAWALSESYVEGVCELKFVDSLEISAALRDIFQIDPLSSIELNGPFKALPFLSDRDIKYWKPQTLGEGMFNWWD